MKKVFNSITSIKMGFSLAEMLIVMLILTVVLAASMPIVTKKTTTTAISSGGTPIGTIITWASEKMPKGEENKWLLCDGKAYSREDYPDLYYILGDTYGSTSSNFNVPDYQGLFLRGKGSQDFSQNNGSLIGITSTTYSSENFGTIQGDATRNITGYYDTDITSNYFVTTVGNQKYSGMGGAMRGEGWPERETNPNGNGNFIISGSVASAWHSIIDFDCSRVVPVSNENRPINTSVYYLIKAKN